MMNGQQCRCESEGNNIIITTVYNGNTKWREAAWNKPFWGTGRYDDIGSERSAFSATNHCGMQVQSGTILVQFENSGSIQTYQATYSSGNSMNTPTLYGSAMSGKFGDLIKTGSGIGYSVILTNSGILEFYEGTITGTYQLVYTSALNIGTNVSVVQALMFGSVFAVGVLGDFTWSNKVIMIDSSVTRTDHFVGVAPYNVLQGQLFNVDIALPMITLPREYPPGTFYYYGPYKYQVLTPTQAVLIIESTIMQSEVI
jgi:hypothetical protein